MSSQTKSGRRTVLKDNSWIRRNAEEDEPVDDDPNFGKVVLSQQRPVDDVSSKPVEAEKPPVNSGTSISSLSKRFSGSQELLNKSSTTTNTKSSATVPPSPTKPPVPAKNPVLKTPNTSSFTARVFSGANTSSKTLSPVKPSFGEKFPEVSASQTTNGQDQSSAGAPASVTVSPAAAPSVTSTSTGAKTPAVTTAVKSPSRSESVSVSTRVSTSSTPSAQTSVTNTQTSSWTLDETPAARPAEKPSASPKLSDVSGSPSAVTSRYTYQTPSAPLDDLADTLLPSLSGGVQSQPVRSQTQVKTVYPESPAASLALRSPLQTTLESSSRSISGRDLCTVCGKPIAGAERMILEELKIISHTSCFRCSVCHCDLGGLEAGKSLWVHRERVNCSNCFSKIRGQWYI